jgi:hypothetical protein
MAELELDIDSHRYTLDGVTIPGCTSVLAAMGATPGFNFLSPSDLEFYRSRGHAVHSAVEYSVKGTLDRRTLVEEVRPYLRGWEKAVHDLGIEVLELHGEPFVEKPLSHPVFRYGVKPDVVARIGNQTGPIEIKATSAHAPATGVQLAAQLIAIRHVMPKIGDMRVGLRLLPAEPYYDFRYYTDRSDESTWISFMNSYNWLKTHKLLKETPR